jgi:hypothetical protein
MNSNTAQKGVSMSIALMFGPAYIPIPLGRQIPATAGTFNLPGTKDWHMTSQPIVPLRARAAEHDPSAFPLVLKRPGRTWFARFGAEPARQADPYLLVLVAEQEIRAGREQDARTLVDAAYAAFDRRIGDQ